MGCFKLPTTFLNDLESMIAQFWWGKQGKRSTHWLNWEELCRSKKEGGLGFRRLEPFNLSMLARQAWRIFLFPDSLLGRVFKAKYFQNGDLLTANKGHYPSWTWRSIYGAIPIIKNGLRWRVGNGEGILIWSDRWIPRPITFRVISPINILPACATVQALICPSTGDWNRDLISEIFLAPDAEAITSIPLGSTDNQDTLVWHFSKNGKFTVKSAYFIALQSSRSKTEARTGTSSRNFMSDLLFIWKRRLPPKIAAFSWRAFRDILPTRYNLFRKHLLDNPFCEHCDNIAETGIHALRDCHFARQTWALTHIPHQVVFSTVNSIGEWFQHVFEVIEAESFDFFLTCCWALWYRRNQTIFGTRHSNPMDVISFSREFLQSFSSAVEVSDVSQRQELISRWILPLGDYIKVNFDAALFKEKCLIGAGVVARNARGECVAWCAKTFVGPLVAEIAEAIAAKVAAQLCKHHSWPKVEFEGDCSSVLTELIQEEQSFSQIGTIVNDVKRLLVGCANVKFVLCRRTANGVAHKIARNAQILDDSIIPIPYVIQDALSWDLS